MKNALKAWNDSEPVRLRLYAVLVPVLAILAAKGLIDSSDVALYSAVAVAVLGIPTTEAVRKSVVSPKTAREEVKAAVYVGDHRA